MRRQDAEEDEHTAAHFPYLVKFKPVAVLIGISALMVVLFTVLFMGRYMQLSRTIENERFTYIDELQTQLLERMDMERRTQMSLLSNLADTLSLMAPDSFGQLSGLAASYEDEEGDLSLLVSDDGTLYDLSGRIHALTDLRIPLYLLNEKREIYSYSVIDHTQEYWLCGIPADSFTLDGTSFSAVIRARHIENFAGEMTVSMFDNQGFSFIVDQYGATVLAPPTDGLMGYNILRSMERMGLEKSVSDAIARDLTQGVTNQRYVEFNGARWLLKYSAQSYEDWITVILMPVSITGADTYKVLSQTMQALIFLVFSTLILIALIISNYFSREQRRRQQESEMQIRLAQSTAQAKNDFLAKMSHDIRTPLNAIIGTLYLAGENSGNQERVSRYIGISQESANYLLGLLNDILDMSKIESGKLEIRQDPVDLVQELEKIKTMNSQAAGKGVLFTVTGMDQITCRYLGDSLRLNQVLMNLVSNAIKFTGQGGRVTLNVAVAALDETRDEVAFSVEDTGIGMTEEFTEKLFTPFTQEDSSIVNKYGGSGLGLSIVKNLVDLMGGMVRVTSEKGVGSRFEVSLLMTRLEGSADALPEPAEQHEEDCGRLCGRRVLLVEDNALNAMIAVEILTSVFQLEVDTVSDGRQAVDRLSQCGPGRYELVFMDVFMPVMDGLTATRMIRELPSPYAKTVPIICMSANAFDEDVKTALESGMDGHLAKPLDVEKLKTVLLTYIQ